MTTRDRQRPTARIVLVAFASWILGCGGSQSQEPSPTTITTTSAASSTTTEVPSTTTLPASPPTLPAQPPQSLGKQELRDLVAPVALYPDVVLASLLPATTNPDQVHDAAAWVGQAQQVDRVPQDRGWDGSVIGLLQFPDVLRWLDTNPAWTEQMGQAVTYQQGDVLAAIQDYRRAVRDVGNLKSNQYQNVRSAPDGDVRIEPARKDVVYVPSYDPAAAMQPQPEPSGGGINPWIAFGGGAVVGALGAWALYSIFDDDDDDHHGGGKHIRRYNDYYYDGGRRPQSVDWAPRRRPYRPYADGVQRPHRLEHRAPAGRPAPALRPPMTEGTTSGSQPPKRPGQVRREQRQERRREHQSQQHEQRQQQRQRRDERRDRRQQDERQRRDRRQEQRQQRQERREERRQPNRRPGQEGDRKPNEKQGGNAG